MSFEKASSYLESRGFGDRVKTFTVSSATVELHTLSGSLG